jgi:hypothetical protein
MTAIANTTMTADLQAIGLDAKTLPTLAKLEPEKLRKVMRTFTKSLGIKCGDCHNESDFSAPTPMKKIASHMWDDYVRALAMNDGSPIYCDTCHQGRPKLLDRHDKKALGKWMDANFVSKLTRRDKKDHGCETCHGDPFEGHILAAWTK